MFFTFFFSVVESFLIVFFCSAQQQKRKKQIWNYGSGTNCSMIKNPFVPIQFVKIFINSLFDLKHSFVAINGHGNGLNPWIHTIFVAIFLVINCFACLFIFFYVHLQRCIDTQFSFFFFFLHSFVSIRTYWIFINCKLLNVKKKETKWLGMKYST